MGYQLSKKAELDLINIWEYTFHKWSKKQADRYIKLLIDEIKFLSKNPKTGKDQQEIREGYQCTQMKSHLIFYKQKDKTSIEVIRVLHQRMDTDSHL
ncbi:MAG: toxin ParE1/3/4 [Bacteroidia bacterium]